LTAAQYRSLLINNAVPMNLKSPPQIERVMRTGSGVMNLSSAVNGTVTAFPTSMSFGAGSGTAGYYDSLTITNVGKRKDTYTISSIPYDDQPALVFADDIATGLRGNAAKIITIDVNPGQSRTIYPFWIFNGRTAGEYQGQIGIRGTQGGANILVPYWYAVPSNVPAVVTSVLGYPVQLTAGRQTNLYFRVIDSSGVPILNPQALNFRGTVLAGGGAIGPLQFDAPFPNLVYTTIRMGSAPGTNTFRLQFGNLPPITFSVTGVAARTNGVGDEPEFPAATLPARAVAAP
jgi:hypothetical protein